VRDLGQGSSKTVVLAYDTKLDREVALCLIDDGRERVEREAKVMGRLGEHANIATIYDWGEDGGRVYMVVRHLAGGSLKAALGAGGLPVETVTRIGRDIADALDHAHAHGIVHRDVKPDNILLEAGTGRALVTDFGIAHGSRDSGVMTDPGKIMGTAHFMSPEQAAGAAVDGRSDIYALGVVGYLSVSGRLPLEASDVPALLLRQATEPATSVMRAAPGLPSALGAAIDRCLTRDPAGRFADGEALAEALAPASDARPALPPTLRAWLSARNPLLLPYIAWSGGFSILTLGNLYAWLSGGRGTGPVAVATLAAIAASPLLPIVGFHLNQAHRQFRAGHTLADLRAALAVARREREETEAVTQKETESRTARVLRGLTLGSAAWLGTTFGLVLSGVVHERNLAPVVFIAPLLSTMLFGAVSNALDVQFIPARIRNWWQTGIRERLWNSQLGDWLARRLGAPERTQLAGASAFRATEAALGVAASELFEALPKAYREQLTELPTIVAALEARAAEARAEMDVVAAMAPSGSADADVLAARKNAAATRLAESVAALEGLRLDLLRLHAGTADLQPLTTLMDAARQIGEDVGRLAEAQREAEHAASEAFAPSRPPTP
jgi:eukaryotic-like serine/threonine-protein kinase